MDILRNFVQYGHLSCFAGALLWLAYLFNDLKHAGMVEQSWMRIVISAIMTTLVLGLGAAMGLG